MHPSAPFLVPLDAQSYDPAHRHSAATQTQLGQGLPGSSPLRDHATRAPPPPSRPLPHSAPRVDPEAVRRAESELLVLKQLQRAQDENAALRAELGNLDPEFFESVEDMKYR